MDLFEHLPILPRSEIFFMFYQNVLEGYVVKQLYRTAMDQPLMIEMFGEVTNGTFQDLRTIFITSRRRQHLQGIQLKASMVVTNNDTLKHLTDYM